MIGCTAYTVYIIRKSKFPQNPKRSVRFSGKGTKRSVQKRKARNTQKPKQSFVMTSVSAYNFIKNGFITALK